ncbi:hypothetical protein MAPG_08181 [Magnaporthiopsis poae ATCC 64411]|uniref:Uncharacterized protein n=1 Tax=Magnaporthiopsis poae (strain ATCC 64411 / 73-15) TaxID=644358 RepID=A0A0C4E6N7_MAGP6|nr:hypothetical protein MAPG_08181 [Magnaporthiopsis poae ATCC 64411]
MHGILNPSSSTPQGQTGAQMDLYPRPGPGESSGPPSAGAAPGPGLQGQPPYAEPDSGQRGTISFPPKAVPSPYPSPLTIPSSTPRPLPDSQLLSYTAYGQHNPSFPSLGRPGVVRGTGQQRQSTSFSRVSSPFQHAPFPPRQIPPLSSIQTPWPAPPIGPTSSPDDDGDGNDAIGPNRNRARMGGPPRLPMQGR